MKSLLLVLLLTAASCSKEDNFEYPKACYEFLDDSFNVVLTKCEMTEREAADFFNANGYKGYRKK